MFLPTGVSGTGQEFADSDNSLEEPGARLLCYGLLLFGFESDGALQVTGNRIAQPKVEPGFKEGNYGLF